MGSLAAGFLTDKAVAKVSFWICGWITQQIEIWICLGNFFRQVVEVALGQRP